MEPTISLSLGHVLQVTGLDMAVVNCKARIDVLSTWEMIHTVTSSDLEKANGGPVDFKMTCNYGRNVWSIDIATSDGCKNQKRSLWLNIESGISTTLKKATVFIDDQRMANQVGEIKIGYGEPRVFNYNLHTLTAPQEKQLKKVGTKITVRLMSS
jgi:hypothetical protein